MDDEINYFNPEVTFSYREIDRAFHKAYWGGDIAELREFAEFIYRRACETCPRR